MRKKILAILMATVTVGSLLSGCGGAKSGEATGKTESSKQESSDSEEPAEIVFAYMTQNNIPESSELERIQNLINDYTVDKINTKVKLVLFSNSDYMNQVNLMLASGEQIDLFQSLNTPHLKYMKDGTALDITAYLDDELKETKEIVYDKFLEPTTIEGKTYGIMNMGSAYVPGGFTYREDIAEELGIDMSQVTSPEDLTDVFAKVQEAYPSMVIIDPNRADSMFGTYLGSRVGFDGLGDSNTSNVSGVAYQGDATVVDIYETPEFKEVCDLARSWFEAGYYANDAATTTATTATGFVNNTILDALGKKGVDWYTAKTAWPFILVIVYLWKNAGYNAIVYMAGIAGIDKEIYEAAKIDGASKMKQITAITLPLLRPTIIIMTLMAIGRVFYSDFGLFYQVPMNAGTLFSTTQTIDTYVYRGLMEQGNVGMSSAAGVYQSLVGFALVMIANFIVRKKDPENALF